MLMSMFLAQLLRAAEGGSLPDIQALEQTWPHDIIDATKALTILLRHLDRTRIPDSRCGLDALDEAESHHALVIRDSIYALEAVFEYMDGLAEAHLNRLLKVFQEYLSDLLAALDFISTFNVVLLADKKHYFDGSAQLGASVAAGHIAPLISFGIRFFEQEEGHVSLERLVNHLLNGWLYALEDAAPADKTVLSAAMYRLYDPLHSALPQCTTEVSTMTLLCRAVMSLGKKKVQIFAQSFTYRCVEWATIHRPVKKEETGTTDCSKLTSFISAACLLVSALKTAPAFEHALLESGFLQLAMKLALEFRDAPSNRPSGGSVATEIASELCPNNQSHAATLVPTLQVLFDGGLLEIILDDILIPGQENYSRWYGHNPLLYIFGACHHPRVYDALSRAELNLPDSTARMVESNPRARKAFEKFLGSIEIYKRAAEEATRTNLPFNCACLDVSGLNIFPASGPLM